MKDYKQGEVVRAKERITGEDGTIIPLDICVIVKKNEDGTCVIKNKHGVVIEDCTTDSIEPQGKRNYADIVADLAEAIDFLVYSRKQQVKIDILMAFLILIPVIIMCIGRFDDLSMQIFIPYLTIVLGLRIVKRINLTKDIKEKRKIVRFYSREINGYWNLEENME